MVDRNRNIKHRYGKIHAILARVQRDSKNNWKGKSKSKSKPVWKNGKRGSRRRYGGGSGDGSCDMIDRDGFFLGGCRTD
jgi:hypothetical protein